MKIFIGNDINLTCFDSKIRQAFSDLNSVLVAAAETSTAEIESTHFLMCLPDVVKGVTISLLSSQGINKDEWRSGLGSCVEASASPVPFIAVAPGVLHDSATRMLNDAVSICEKAGRSAIDEAILLYCAITNLTPKVRDLCADAGIETEQWQSSLEKLWCPVEPVIPFTSGLTPKINREAFSKSGRIILDLLKSEAEALGAADFDVRHLALALVDFDGGSIHNGLFLQGVAPRKIQEAIMLSMRRGSTGRRQELPLVGDSFQPLLRQILEEAGRLAGQEGESQISEKRLSQAFVYCQSSTLQLFEQQKVSLEELKDSICVFQPGNDENEDEMAFAMADIETIERRLRERIIGQDEAIERILPHVQRFRFGFSNSNRPVGVFLFCGQSGSGKTEMAKELARSVFESEENLIFLEMGQFNSPESMNIFVGAAPGYVGYGEGQLTNGLRDKPKSVVLFDEVEKAHARVLDALLRFLDEGRISDPAGPVRDGSKCIVILTSNVGAEELGKLASELKGTSNGRHVLRQRLREELKARNFRVEFLNRVDEIILFSDLSRENYAEIARRQMAVQLARLKAEHEIEVTLDPSVAESIGEWCAQLSEGARAAHRLMQSMVITPVIDQVFRYGSRRPLMFKVRAISRAGEEPEGLVEPIEMNENG